MNVYNQRKKPTFVCLRDMNDEMALRHQYSSVRWRLLMYSCPEKYMIHIWTTLNPICVLCVRRMSVEQIRRNTTHVRCLQKLHHKIACPHGYMIRQQMQRTHRFRIWFNIYIYIYIMKLQINKKVHDSSKRMNGEIKKLIAAQLWLPL